MPPLRGRGGASGCISHVLKMGTVFLVTGWILAILSGFSPGFFRTPALPTLPTLPTESLSETDFDSPIPEKRAGQITDPVIIEEPLPNSRPSAQIRRENRGGDEGAGAGAGGRGEAYHVELPIQRPRPVGWNKDPMAYPKPKTFFDISIDGKAAGRIVFELYTKQSPRWAENFRALCTGEKGTVPTDEAREGAGEAYHFKGKPFYRVIDQFICQTGVGTESIYGGHFVDDIGGLMLKHHKRGLLSAANMGPDTNTSHFSILVAPAPHLDGHYTIFGEVVDGYDVVEKINALAKPNGQPDEWPSLSVVIEDSGQLECKEDGTCEVMQF